MHLERSSAKLRFWKGVSLASCDLESSKLLRNLGDSRSGQTSCCHLYLGSSLSPRAPRITQVKVALGDSKDPYTNSKYVQSKDFSQNSTNQQISSIFLEIQQIQQIQQPKSHPHIQCIYPERSLKDARGVESHMNRKETNCNGSPKNLQRFRFCSFYPSTFMVNISVSTSKYSLYLSTVSKFCQPVRSHY